MADVTAPDAQGPAVAREEPAVGSEHTVCSECRIDGTCPNEARELSLEITANHEQAMRAQARADYEGLQRARARSAPTNPSAPCPVCRADVATVDGLLVVHRHRDQFGPCPAGQVETGPDVVIADPLERADRFVRHVAERWTGDPENHFGVFVAEYDRMRAELTKTVADCGICTLGARTIHINDDCPRHNEGDDC